MNIPITFFSWLYWGEKEGERRDLDKGKEEKEGEKKIVLITRIYQN